MKEIQFKDLDPESKEKLKQNVPLSIQEKFKLVYEDGTEEYYYCGVLHREDGPALKYYSGTTFWYKNGILHREGGPAAEYNDGGHVWAINGKKHKLDGPALVDEKFVMWFINDKQVSEEDVQKLKSTEEEYINQVRNLMLLKYQ